LRWQFPKHTSSPSFHSMCNLLSPLSFLCAHAYSFATSKVT
jgi:hypothetical protein